jgi:hypothetical protein
VGFYLNGLKKQSPFEIFHKKSFFSPFFSFPLNFEGEFAGAREHNSQALGGEMANSVLSYPKAYHVEALILGLFCLLAASCDLPRNLGDEKGSLTITLPGSKAPGRDLTAARAVHLPEAITGDMSYNLEFYKSGPPIIIDTTEKTLTIELEAGRWDIVVTALYGTAMAAFDKKPQVEIRAGQANSVSFTMDADDFIMPAISSSYQTLSISTTDSSPPSYSITIDPSSAFSSIPIPGWSDDFRYRVYYEDAGGLGNPIPLGPDLSFPGNPAPSFSYTVINSTEGTFRYYVEITNSYTCTPPGGGSGTSGTVTKNIYVATVVVTNGTIYSIGSTGPGGGIVFYADPAVGFTSNGVLCHYLEAAPADLGPAPWSTTGTTATGATGMGIGAGHTNTLTIIAALPGETTAAPYLARNYPGGGLNDWFLPSRGELVALYTSGITGLVSSLGSSMWSSTEDTSTNAWSAGNAGSPGYWSDTKNISPGLTFRPVRAF